MGWVRILYPSQRRVLVDGEDLGNTNRLIFIGVDGTHTFRLDPPVDYKPRSRRRRVINTSRRNPLELEFEPRVSE
jgi:hypothetical protein